VTDSVAAGRFSPEAEEGFRRRRRRFGFGFSADAPSALA
jgi:hypothetical protein